MNQITPHHRFDTEEPHRVVFLLQNHDILNPERVVRHPNRDGATCRLDRQSDSDGLQNKTTFCLIAKNAQLLFMMATEAPLVVNRPQRTSDFYCTLIFQKTGLKIQWPKNTINASLLKKIFRSDDLKMVNESTEEVLDPTKEVSLKKGQTYLITDSTELKQIEAELEALALDEQKQKGVFRYRSNEILDGLWLGDVGAMQQHHQMKKERITHVLSILDGGTTTEDYPLKHEIITVPDVHTTDMYAHFQRTNDYIASARSQRDGGVLVHCMAGISRSPTVILAYLMKELDLSLADANFLLKASRAQIYPNQGFINQLMKYEEDIKPRPPPRETKKRGFTKVGSHHNQNRPGRSQSVSADAHPSRGKEKDKCSIQ
ncbi:hypothetical protein PROFUN_06865 [Planoprotostelium fungivorum]|uniref:protein-tyrosine-phosphatase n=1 Tax=Planoprotostelium fungivorum TaxID=1890364 RepID=A0A2P6NNG7_9EUKA|nr:hypothetical protein PROFUN_06865 [Planoprotostelium fungivorum]